MKTNFKFLIKINGRYLLCFQLDDNRIFALLFDRNLNLIDCCLLLLDRIKFVNDTKLNN